MATTHPFLADLQLDTTGGGVWVTLGGLSKFKEPPVKYGKSKTGNLKTLVHTYKKGWGDPGECPFTIYFSQAEYKALIALRDLPPDTAEKSFRAVYNNAVTGGGHGTIVGFNGYVAEVGNAELSDDSENEIMTDGVLQMSGNITITDAT